MGFPFFGHGRARKAAAAAFDPALEYHPDPGLDNPGAATLTGTGLAVTGSAAVATSTGGAAKLEWAPTTPIVAGTYRVTVVVGTVWNTVLIPVYVGGNTANISISGGGVSGQAYSVDIVCGATTQILRVGSFVNGKSGSITEIHVNRVA